MITLHNYGNKRVESKKREEVVDGLVNIPQHRQPKVLVMKVQITSKVDLPLYRSLHVSNDWLAKVSPSGFAEPVESAWAYTTHRRNPNPAANIPILKCALKSPESLNALDPAHGLAELAPVE